MVEWVRMAISASNSQPALGCREESTSTIPLRTWFLRTLFSARAAVCPATTCCSAKPIKAPPSLVSGSMPCQKIQGHIHPAECHQSCHPLSLDRHIVQLSELPYPDPPHVATPRYQRRSKQPLDEATKHLPADPFQRRLSSFRQEASLCIKPL